MLAGVGDVLGGFLAIWVVIGSGWLLAHLRVLDTTARDVLSKVTFYIGSPALLGLMLATADLQRLFARHLVVTIAATLAAAGLYVLLARLLISPARGQLVMGAMAASYVNSANLGIPITAYVLKDVTWVAPLLLFQVALLQPVLLTMLDRDRADRDGTPVRGWWANLSLPLRNPMTVGTLVGLAINLLGWSVPPVLAAPIELLAALAVPCMLIAFGVSLRLGPLPGRGAELAETTLASLVKLVAHPMIAWALALALGLDAATTMAVVVLAGLPTAQNVFVYSVRYRRGVVLVRDTVFITTIASILTITVVTAWLHP